MLKLIKCLRPFIWSIVLIFLLLFAQAMTDLSLPDFMSRIVNVGIQQNGISRAVPEVIRAGEMQKLVLFLSDADKAAIGSDYLLLDRNQLSPGAYNEYLKSYPGLADGPLYKLNTADKVENDRLDNVFRL